MRYLVITTAILAIGAQSAIASSMDPKLTGDPMHIVHRNYHKRSYPAYRLDTGDVRIFDDNGKVGNLRMVEGGTGGFGMRSDYGEMRDLTLESAKKFFGEPSLICESPRNPKDQLVTFNLKTKFDRDEPDIFHLDFEIEKDGKVQYYRVRAIDMPQPEWQTVTVE